MKKRHGEYVRYRFNCSREHAKLHMNFCSGASVIKHDWKILLDSRVEIKNKETSCFLKRLTIDCSSGLCMEGSTHKCSDETLQLTFVLFGWQNVLLIQNFLMFLSIEKRWKVLPHCVCGVTPSRGTQWSSNVQFVIDGIRDPAIQGSSAWFASKSRFQINSQLVLQFKWVSESRRFVRSERQKPNAWPWLTQGNKGEF